VGFSSSIKTRTAMGDCFERQARTGDSNETLLLLEILGSDSICRLKRSSVVLQEFHDTINV